MSTPATGNLRHACVFVFAVVLHRLVCKQHFNFVAVMIQHIERKPRNTWREHWCGFCLLNYCSGSERETHTYPALTDWVRHHHQPGE